MRIKCELSLYATSKHITIIRSTIFAIALLDDAIRSFDTDDIIIVILLRSTIFVIALLDDTDDIIIVIRRGERGMCC